MPEMTSVVSPKLIYYLCDKCGEGGLVSTGNLFPNWPAKYEHICDCCNARSLLNESYPRVDFDVID
jgi:hypothetical protein